jgi:imidazoleglycerol phosphate synthase glutamine amidotransferase subunit HisH
MIAVLDYGIGNIGSIRNMLMKAGENDVEFVDRSKQLVKAEKII